MEDLRDEDQLYFASSDIRLSAEIKKEEFLSLILQINVKSSFKEIQNTNFLIKTLYVAKNACQAKQPSEANPVARLIIPDTFKLEGKLKLDTSGVLLRDNSFLISGRKKFDILLNHDWIGFKN